MWGRGGVGWCGVGSKLLLCLTSTRVELELGLAFDNFNQRVCRHVIDIIVTLTKYLEYSRTIQDVLECSRMFKIFNIILQCSRMLYSSKMNKNVFVRACYKEDP